MLRSRAKILMYGGAMAVLLAAIPVFGDKKPQSLLPPGFGQSAPAKDSARPVPTPPADSGNSAAPHDLLDELKLNAPANNATAATSGGDNAPSAAEADALGNVAAAVDDTSAIPTPKYDLPPQERRSLAQIGLLTPAMKGMNPGAFGALSGHRLEAVMRATAAPVASRWVSIILRRALLSKVTTPHDVNGADWAAERAWLLLRMGEADSARLLIQQVDTDNYTPKLDEVAMQSALASADLASICPIQAQGEQRSDDAAWSYARAICAALAGDAGAATSYLREAQQDTGIGGIDAQFAERVVGAGKNARRAVDIQWDNVYHLDTWRFGTASAVGLTIPATLYNTSRPNVRAWSARLPMLKLSDRADGADWAATLGVYSSAALVDFYSALADESDTTQTANSVPALLKDAYAGDTQLSRLEAMHTLWSAPNLDDNHIYARLILTARAAAALEPDSGDAKYGDALIASMLSAGLDTQAERWARALNSGSDDAARRTWGLLAVGAPQNVVDISSGQISAYQSTGVQRTRFLVASLIGLGRINAADAGGYAREYDINFGLNSPWTRAIDAAARRHEQGTVALLAAAGMQSLNWQDVPPEFLLHIVAAFRTVGMEPEARMIAAEALTRA
ncbi:MAG: hypothetical protein KGJ05_03550 [Alphaproteobacteria bacterium]|nr:hypothetical protein [Alphaproteobacteria bacterium]